MYLPNMQVPEELALISRSRNELLGALLVPAHALLQELVAHAASLRASKDDMMAQELLLHHRSHTSLSPREVMVLHLMHTVGAAPAARLTSAECDQVSALLEMLEGKKLMSRTNAGPHNIEDGNFNWLIAPSVSSLCQRHPHMSLRFSCWLGVPGGL